MTLHRRMVAAILSMTFGLVGCASENMDESPEPNAGESAEDKSIASGLESACSSVEELVGLTPVVFPGTTKPDETDEERIERREPFQTELASLTAVLATIPRDSGYVELLESLDSAAAAASTVAEAISNEGEDADAASLQGLFDVEVWGEPLRDWHSSAQTSSELCVESEFASRTPDALGESSQFFDLLPYGAWDYQASEDDFGVVRHNWTAAATTNEPFAVGNLSLFIVCWGDDVIIGPSPRPYTTEAFGAYAVGGPTQGVEIAFGGGQGIWQTFVVDGTTIGLYPTERESDFRSGNPDLQSQISRESIEQFMDYETVSIGSEFSVGEISGKNYVHGLDLVVERMEQLGCW